MNKEELQIEYVRLLKIKSLREYKEILDVYANFLVNIGYKYRQVFKEEDIYAGTMLQMFLCKNISLQKMLEGIDYKSNEDIYLNNILDSPTIIAHARTIYELLCTFELVYVLPDTDEKKLILYNLWCLAGLNSRQSFYSDNMSDEHKQQFLEEKEQIDNCIAEIKATTIYNIGNNAKVIDEQIKKKKVQIIIDSNGIVKSYGLKQIPSFFNMNKTGLFNEVYNYFSMYAHSSYISMLQFEEMFKNRDDIHIISYILKNVLAMYSVFLTDYLYLFPHIKPYFFEQSLETQMRLRVYAKFITQETCDLDEKWIKAID